MYKRQARKFKSFFIFVLALIMPIKYPAFK